MFETYEEIKGSIVTIFKNADEPLATPDIRHCLNQDHGVNLGGSYRLEHALGRMAEEGLLIRAKRADCEKVFGWAPSASSAAGRSSLTIYWAWALVVGAHRATRQHEQCFTCRPECCHHVDQMVQQATVRNIVERSDRPLTARDVTSIMLSGLHCSRADLDNHRLKLRITKLLEGLGEGGRLVVALYRDHETVFGCRPQEPAALSTGTKNARYWWSTASTPQRILQAV